MVERNGASGPNNNALETSLGPFVGADAFSLSFVQPLLAFGLFAFSGDGLWDGDLTLSTDQGSVALAAADLITGQALVDDFDFAEAVDTNLYFLGLTAGTQFQSARLSSFDAGFTFGIDDLRMSAVPAPSSALLLAGLPFLRRLGSNRRASIA